MRTHPVTRGQRRGTYCEDYETDGCSVDVCPEGCWLALGDDVVKVFDEYDTRIPNPLYL